MSYAWDHLMIAVLALSLSPHVSRWEKWVLRVLAAVSILNAAETVLTALPDFIARHWHG